MGHGVCLLEGAEVGDLGPAVVGVDANHAIGDIGYAVRAAGAGQDTIEGIADKGDIGYARRGGAILDGGLGGRKSIDPGSALTGRAHAGDTGAGIATGIWTYGCDYGCATGGVGATDTGFRHIEIAIWSEFEAPGIVETSGEHDRRRDIVAGAAIADTGEMFLTGE